MRTTGAPRNVDRRGAVLVGAIVLQGAIGYTQYFVGVPPLLVGLHVAGSIVVWITVLRFHLGLFAHSIERPEIADQSPTHAGLGTIDA